MTSSEASFDLELLLPAQRQNVVKLYYICSESHNRCRQLETVVWSPRGQLFAIPMDCNLELSTAEKAGVLHSLKMLSKVTACVFLSDKVVCVGEASGEISGHCTETSNCLWSIAGDQRVRGLAYHLNYLVSVTSSGTICVFSMPNVATQPQQVATTDTGCRITCLTLYDHKSVNSVQTESLQHKKLNTIGKTNSTKCKLNTPKLDTTESSQRRKALSSGKTKNEAANDNINLIRKSAKKLSKQTTPNKGLTFQEVGLAEIKTSKRKTNEFIEEKQKSSKKQKIAGVNKKLGNIICSPQAQKWVVEDCQTS